MELTQKDFEDRKARVEDGSGDDEDARLVKLYEREGFTVKQVDQTESGFETQEEGEGHSTSSWVGEKGPKVQEGDEGWPGSSTERSSETTPNSSGQNENDPESPAPTTENDSTEDPEASSTARPGTSRKNRR